jgi:hypothetical protein
VTVKSERVYWVDCDRPGCAETSMQMSPTAHTAIIRAERDYWRRIDGRWMCPDHLVAETHEHRLTWPS